MSYATAEQFLTHFGAIETAHRSAPESNLVDSELMFLTVTAGDRSAYSAEEIAAADSALIRLNDALERASMRINGKLAKCYAIPLSATPSGIVDANCHIARWLLYDDGIPEHVEKFYQDAMKFLDIYRDCDVPLLDDDGNPLTPASEATPVGMADFSTPGREFTHTTLADFR